MEWKGWYVECEEHNPWYLSCWVYSCLGVGVWVSIRVLIRAMTTFTPLRWAFWVDHFMHCESWMHLFFGLRFIWFFSHIYGSQPILDFGPWFPTIERLHLASCQYWLMTGSIRASNSIYIYICHRTYIWAPMWLTNKGLPCVRFYIESGYM